MLSVSIIAMTDPRTSINPDIPVSIDNKTICWFLVFIDLDGLYQGNVVQEYFWYLPGLPYYFLFIHS